VIGKARLEYYGYVRRLPNKAHSEPLFEHFFKTVNPLNSPLDETVFREQLQKWWTIAHEILLQRGLDALPEEFKCFPALIFQALALSLQFLPTNHGLNLEGLKFGPFQTDAELSREYTDCGIAVSKIIGKARLTLTGVQYSFMRDWWYVNAGDLTRAWNLSGQTVKYDHHEL
jgi:hypothetical protein